MPVSKHAKAQRRIRGTTYKLVRRGYLERQAEANGAVPESEARGENDWVPEAEIHRAYKNLRRGDDDGDDGNPFFNAHHHEHDVDLGEDADYWEEEGEAEGEYYDEEDGEDGEWVDDDDAFDAMFGDGDEGEEDGEVDAPREDVLVRAAKQDRRKQQPQKTVHFNLDAPAAAAGEGAVRPTVPNSALKKQPPSHDARAEEDELAEEVPTGHVQRTKSAGKRGGRRMEHGEEEDDDFDDDFEGDVAGTHDYERGYPDDDAFHENYEEDDRGSSRHRKKHKSAPAVGASASRPMATTEGDDDKLFDDEVECEVTDEFLRQLVFGPGPAAAVARGGGARGGRRGGASATMHGDDDDNDEDDDWCEEPDRFNGSNPPAGMDQEVWQLLTEEERQAVLETQQRGTRRARRETKKTTLAGSAAIRDELYDDEHELLDAEDGVSYPQHDERDHRALERQFDAMMDEFDADMPINDFFAQDEEGNSTGVEFTDPRTMGALSIDKYFSALEEFVEKRAGVDLEKNEPRKNKGLLTQLKFLAHNAGAFDYNEKEHGVFLTNNVSDKQRRFVEEFRSETEQIKREAKMRVLKRMLEDRRRREAGLPSLEEEEERRDIERAAAGGKLNEDDNDEAYEVIEVRNPKKEDRLDCETAVSAYSSYYNQPNVIRAPASSKMKRKSAGKPPRTAGRQDLDGPTNLTSDDGMDEGLGKKTSRSSAVRKDYGGGELDKAVEGGSSVARPVGELSEVNFVRDKNETKEEKKLRRQAVKQMQRERRQEKSSLKKAYKEVEKEETGRAAVSASAKRTIKFM